MSTNRTEHYKLNLWEPEDRVLREDFNADNAAIDAALRGIAQQAGTLSTNKADASALAAEVQARTTLAAQVAKLGNCQIYYTSYIGDGAESRTITFPHKPVIVFIMGNNVFFRAVPGAPCAMSNNSGGEGVTCGAEWSGNTLTWKHTSVSSVYWTFACNDRNETYQLIALLDAAE